LLIKKELEYNRSLKCLGAMLPRILGKMAGSGDTDLPPSRKGAWDPGKRRPLRFHSPFFRPLLRVTGN